MTTVSHYTDHLDTLRELATIQDTTALADALVAFPDQLGRGLEPAGFRRHAHTDKRV